MNMVSVPIAVRSEHAALRRSSLLGATMMRGLRNPRCTYHICDTGERRRHGVRHAGRKWRKHRVRRVLWTTRHIRQCLGGRHSAEPRREAASEKKKKESVEEPIWHTPKASNDRHRVEG